MHLWRVVLTDPPPIGIECAEAMLDASEARRSAAFRFPQDRKRFVIAHAALRCILARFLDTEPSQVRFRYGEYGKPELAEGQAECGWRFNLSHSGEWALIGIDNGREIGVDLEVPKISAPPVEVASMFSPAEQAAIETYSKRERIRALYRCWVRKEALLKAYGRGLSEGLNRFSVTIGPIAMLLESENPALAPSDWSLATLDDDDQYYAAVAVRGKLDKLPVVKDWTWSRQLHLPVIAHQGFRRGAGVCDEDSCY